MMQYRTILADPPWQQPLSNGGIRRRWKGGVVARSLPYPTMPLAEIAALPIADLAAPDCHLWLWTTNAFLEAGFSVMRAWGFRYLAPIVWVKPSGIGNFVIHRTQTILLGYRHRCSFPGRRYFPNIIETAGPRAHSVKPTETYSLIESVSGGPRLELFARARRPGWHAWGNEIEGSISLSSEPMPPAVMACSDRGQTVAQEAPAA
jgi:N6-adenosine-specific RNA methylase IME4